MAASLENVTAAVLAGGLGTRLRPVLAGRPKVLAEVAGRPFLAYLLDQLASAGAREVVLCTGYLAEQVRAALGESYAGMRLSYSREPSGLGTAGALRLAHPLFRGDTVLVLNGDSCCAADLGAFAAWHRARGAEASLLLTRVEDARRYGRTRTDPSGRVLVFDEKTAEPGPGWVNAGVYLLDTGLILTIPTGTAVSLEREVFPAWVRRRFYGCRTGAPFVDVGTPESYARAEAFFRPPDNTAGPARGPSTARRGAAPV